MEKRIILNNQESDFWLEDTGRLRNAKTKRWLKGGINKGYHFYSLYFKGKQYILYTHRAVAEYFVPNPDPENLTIVHHIDGNKTNNIYTNLQWVSPSEHNKTIQEQGKGGRSAGQYYQRVNLEDYGEIAQFRESPYYMTKDGKVINISKKIEIRLEKSGNYLRFQGNYNLNHKHFLVHRAVWEAFNGPIPEGYDIDHIDGNPQNNSLSNLQAITHQENIKKRDMDWSYVADNLNPNR
jgi:hypothetical protein